MKNVLSVAAVICVVFIAFSSCKKHHDCNCDIKTVINEVDTVKSTTSHHTIKGTIEDAEAACQYYETEGFHLGRPSIVYHYCEITEDKDDE